MVIYLTNESSQRVNKGFCYFLAGLLFSYDMSVTTFENLIRRPLGEQLEAEVFCQPLGEVAHSVVIKAAIVTLWKSNLNGKPKGSMMASPTPP